MQARTDDELLSAMQHGDKAAFGHLLDRYKQRLHRLANSVLFNPEDAEDVIQDVFINLWHRRDEWRKEGSASFSTWIYRVTLNKAIDRKRQRRMPMEEIHEESLFDESPMADEMVSERQQRHTLATYMNQLPERQKQSLFLFYYEEMDVKRMSSCMNATEDAIRSLLKNGKRNLKGLIPEEFGAQRWQA